MDRACHRRACLHRQRAKQVCRRGHRTITYDDNANLKTDGTSTYVYDTENRLISASGGQRHPALRSARKALRDVGGLGPIRLLYDGDELVAEYDTSGVMLRRYVHGSASTTRSSGTKAPDRK